MIMKRIKLLSVALILGCASSIAHADVRSSTISNYGLKQLVPVEIIPNVKKLPDVPLLYAQSTDGIRIHQLEERVRFLNGQVEEMQFQLLQMQEQFRKMQEDNEYRFQELEKTSLENGGQENLASVASEKNVESGEGRLGKSQPSDSALTEDADGKELDVIELIEARNFGEGRLLKTLDGAQTKVANRTIDGVEIFDPNKDRSADELGANPNIKFGEFKFDQNGNVITNTIKPATGAPIRLGKPLNFGGTIQSGQFGQSGEVFPIVAKELFDLGYQYVQAGQYSQAVTVFEEFVHQHPTDYRLASAQFWLGESYFAINRYEDAAQTFLQNHKEHPNAKLGAQNLLKLGVSLAGLNQRELACATYAEVPKKYPQISRSVKKRIMIEQQSAKCKN